jgi:LysR family transcriptional regulator (chromosome initiation inhibitor)
VDLDLGQLRAFDATVTAGTLDGAARALHVTPSAISQRLKALEAATGRVLLVRSKPVEVTESGQAVLRLARQVALLAADAARDLDDSGPVTLPIAVNADSLATWVLPALAPWPASWPSTCTARTRSAPPPCCATVGSWRR